MKKTLLLASALMGIGGSALAHDMNAETHSHGYSHARLNLPADWVSHNSFSISAGLGSLSATGGTAEGYSAQSTLSKQLGGDPTSMGIQGSVKSGRFEDGASTVLETNRIGFFIFKPVQLHPSAHLVLKAGAHHNYAGNDKAAVSGSTAGESKTEAAVGIALNARGSNRFDYRLGVEGTGNDTTTTAEIIVNMGEYLAHGISFGVSHETYDSSDVTSLTLGYVYNFAR